jgi:hypothetical protein
MSWGGGGSLITSMPTAPWPKSIEYRGSHLAAANTNPWTAQQQIQDWAADYAQMSVSYAALTQTQATAFIAFLKACNGIVNVFQFPAGLAAKYPESFTSDGTAQRYWRLKTNETGWSIKAGSVYSVTFEIREAL